MSARIESRIPRPEYDGIDAISITRLKELRRSPQHYQYALTHPKATAAMRLGIASHVAVLEPERFGAEFAVWTRSTSAGKMAPRSGQYWDDFCSENEGSTILTPSEYDLAHAISTAVRNDPVAIRYLASGDPEVTLRWELNGRPCKGRADWLTSIDGKPFIVGLKTARDVRPFIFGSQCAKLGYHLQVAFYNDGYDAIHGNQPRMVEIVVESSPPHAVAVYRITGDVIEQGRDEYMKLIDLLDQCERTGEWPGPVPREEDLTLPSWCYEATDDVSDLGLEGLE